MCKLCNWEEQSEIAVSMLGDEHERWVWAAETVAGIQSTIREYSHVSPRQRQALRNIYESGMRQGAPGDGPGRDNEFKDDS